MSRNRVDNPTVTSRRRDWWSLDLAPKEGAPSRRQPAGEARPMIGQKALKVRPVAAAADAGHRSSSFSAPRHLQFSTQSPPARFVQCEPCSVHLVFESVRLEQQLPLPQMLGYYQLNPNGAEIRLLELLPGKTDAQLCCSLRVVSLDKRSKFEALSYVWGDATITRPILVSGEPFQVTTNLEDGLRALRYRRKPRTLWVDAICINQRDVAEKNLQVPPMSRIYRDATRVVAWLGPSNLAIELAVSYAKANIEKNVPTSLYWLNLRLAKVFSNRAKDAYILARLRTLTGHINILSLPYWRRMWTFQEYYIPRAEPVCVCGKQEFRAALMDKLHGLLLQDIKELKFWDLDALSGDCETQLMSSVALLERLEGDLPTGPVRGYSSSKPSSAPDLGSLLLSTSDRRSSDPRDKVYALYGIVPRAAEIFPPDYSKSLDGTYLETATFLINYEHFLPFSIFGLPTGRVVDCSYPWWVPDFNVTNALISSTHQLHPRQMDQFFLATVTDDLTTLSLPAWNLGRIHIVARLAGTIPGVLEQFCNLLENGHPSVTIPGPKRSPEMVILAISRLCIAVSSQGITFSPLEIWSAFCEILEMDSPPEQWQLDRRGKGYTITSFILGGIRKLTGKTLFVTQNEVWGAQAGGIGLEDGDIVAVPPQPGCPLILRNEVATDPNEKSTYVKLVGTALLDGLMKNVEPDQKLIGEIVQQDLEKFLVH